VDRGPGREGPRPRISRMSALTPAGPTRRSSARAVLAAATIACALSATPACGFAVKHPAITAGVVAGSLGFATCKLASDNYAACGLVAGGAGAFLGLVTAAALWLGGDGNSSALDEQAEPLPEEDQPPLPVALPPDPPTTPSTGSPVGPSPATPPPATPPPATPPPATPPSTSPSSTSPSPSNPPPTSPLSTSPAPTNPAPTRPPSTSPAPSNPPSARPPSKSPPPTDPPPASPPSTAPSNPQPMSPP
jgi:hypothetical protein